MTDDEAPAALPTQTDVSEFLLAAREASDLRAKKSALAYARKHGVDLKAKPRTLSQWAMGLLRECSHKYYLAQILGLHQILGKSSLAFGTAIDAAVTRRLRIDGDLAEAHTAFRESWDAAVERGLEFPQDMDAHDFRGAGQILVDRLEPTLDSMNPLYVQHTLDWAPILNPATGEIVPDFVISGRLDIVDDVQLEGMEEPVACITDAKALVQTTKPADQYLQARLSIQLLTYAYAAPKDDLLMELPGIGTMVGYLEGQRKKPPAPRAILKDGTLSKAKQADPPKVELFYADVNAEDIRELLVMACSLVDQIKACKARDADGLPPEVAWPRNIGACNRDAYGSPCEFRSLCRAHLFAEHPGLTGLYSWEPKQW